MDTWIFETFTDPSPDGFPVIYRGAGYVLTYDPANAAADFPSVAVVPTHAALSGLSIAKQGWQKIFNQWKANGVIQ